MNPPDLIKTGESETVEFKEKFDERATESAVAFANTKGGIIFIGVSDKNNIKGVEIGKETINQWVNQISQSTDPRIIPEIEKRFFHKKSSKNCPSGGAGDILFVNEKIRIDEKTVVAVQIKENPIKPVSTKGRSRIKNIKKFAIPLKEPLHGIWQIWRHRDYLSKSAPPERARCIF